MQPKQTLSERFFSKVEKRRSGCWEWVGGLAGAGYGTFFYNGRLVLAHRVSWMMHKGEIPKGHVVRHECDNPACVNPQHLLVGSHSDNSKDMVARGRSPKGERHGNSRLTEDAVRVIRSSPLTSKELAAHFCVSDETVRYVRRGKTWRHVS